MFDWLANILTGGRMNSQEADLNACQGYYSQAMAELETANAGLDEATHGWQKSLDKVKLMASHDATLRELWRQAVDRHDVTIESAKGLARTGIELDSHNTALRELWRHSADRARTWDDATMRLAAIRKALAIDLAGTRETLLEVGNVSEERQQRIQAFEQQQKVSDHVVQRLEAERDEAVQDGNDMEELANKHYADLQTQRYHNDTLNTVQAKLMAERTEAQGLSDGWKQTAGELQYEVSRLETELYVQQNAVKRLDAQLATARANDGRDAKGRFIRQGKK